MTTQEAPAPPPPTPRARKAKRTRPERPPLPPLTVKEQALRGVSALAAAVLIAFSANLILVSHVQHAATQQQLHNAFQAQLAEGVAPVSEGDVDQVLLRDGAPVAVIDVPKIGLHSVVVEGTSSSTLTAGPGHRRDTVLPGQRGESVIMGRAAAYGGPFARIDELRENDTFTVITGQGEHLYAVTGIRYAKDPAAPSFALAESRLTLETATGAPYMPAGVLRVDARLVSEPQDAGLRQTTAATLPPSHQALATDTGMVWALVFALQALIALELALAWAVRRLGRRRVWTVFVPVALLTAFIITDQVIRLLPNLL